VANVRHLESRDGDLPPLCALYYVRVSLLVDLDSAV
jgi:hypothetical protein